MGEFVKNPVVGLPSNNGATPFSTDELVFTPEEKATISQYVAKYPTAEGAVMHVLWLAQEKFGYLPPEVLRLVAAELAMPYAQVYGVATFYTQYYKQKIGTYVLDVCTCFTCQFCGGYDVLEYLEEKLGIKAGQTTEDGRFTVKEVECLGACGTAPMLQVTNGPYVHNLTPKRIDQLIADLDEDRIPPFVSVTLPQDEEELGENRRTDAEAVEAACTPPVTRRTGPA